MVAVWHRGRRSELYDRIADLIGSFHDARITDSTTWSLSAVLEEEGR